MVLFPATMTKLLRSGLVELSGCYYGHKYTQIFILEWLITLCRSSWSWRLLLILIVHHCTATQSPSLCKKSNNIQQKRLSIVNVAESGDIEGVTATQQNWIVCSESEWGSFWVREWGQAGRRAGRLQSAFAVAVNCQFSIQYSDSREYKREASVNWIHICTFTERSIHNILWFHYTLGCEML